MITVIKDFILKTITKPMFLYLIPYSRTIFSRRALHHGGVFCTILRVLMISCLIQINTFQEGICKNNGCYSPETIFSCTFRTQKLAGYLIESSVNIIVNIHISKVFIIQSFLREMQIENTKKKEANNQEDEISEQSLQSQRTEENGEHLRFSSL